METVEDLGINSLGAGRLKKLPKFQCPQKLFRVKSGNLLP